MKNRTFNLKNVLAVFAFICFAVSVSLLFGAKFGAKAESLYTSLEMEKGASVRIGDAYGVSGIRYGMTLSKQDYETVIQNEEVTFGIIIAPASYNEENPLNADNLFGAQAVYDWAVWNGSEWEYPQDSVKTRVINITSGKMSESGDKMVMNAAMVDLKSANLLREFIGVGYISYVSGGETVYEFAAENDNVRSMVFVSQIAAADESGAVDENQKQFLSDNYLTETVLSTQISYNVEYYRDGTLYQTKPQSAALNGVVSVTPETLEGFVFDEKNTGNVTEGILLADGSVLAAGSVQNSLKVYYKSQKTVSFDTGYGSAVASQKVASGECANSPSAPVRYGYSFSGWKLNGEDYDFSTPITEDIELTAVYTGVEYSGATASVENESYEYGNGEVILGKKITAAANQGYRLADNIPFNGDLLVFGLCSKAGNSSVYDLDVVLTDVVTGVRLGIEFMLNSDAVNNGTVYARWLMNGQEIGIKTLTVDMADSGKSTYNSQLTRIQKISVNTDGEFRFAGSFTDGENWSDGFFEKPDLTGFGAEGVSVDLHFNGVNESGSIVVSSVGDSYYNYLVEENQKYVYADGSAIMGKKVTATNSGALVRVTEIGAVAEGMSLVNFGFCNFNGANTVETFSVIFTNLSNASDKLTVTVRIADAKNSGKIYLSYNYNGTDSGERAISVDMSDSGKHQYPGMARFLNIIYKSASPADGSGKIYDLAYNGFTDVSWEYGFNGLDLSSFVAGGVSVDLRFDKVTAPSSVIVASAGGKSYNEGVVSEPNQSHVYDFIVAENRPDESSATITGTKYTAAVAGASTVVAENVAFGGKMIEFGYCNKSGIYTINSFIVSFTDSASNVLKVRFTLNNDIVNASSVYISYSYNNGDWAANIQHTCDMSDKTTGAYGDQVEIMYIEYTAGRLQFCGLNPADWSNGFAVGETLADFGTEGVEVVIIFEDIKSCSSVIVKNAE